MGLLDCTDVTRPSKGERSRAGRASERPTEILRRLKTCELGDARGFQARCPEQLFGALDPQQMNVALEREALLSSEEPRKVAWREACNLGNLVALERLGI